MELGLNYQTVSEADDAREGVLFATHSYRGVSANPASVAQTLLRPWEEGQMRPTPVIALAAALTAFACGGSTTGPTRAPSTFTVLLKDSPFSDAKSLLVTFSEVSAHKADGEWTRLPFSGGASSRTCDLKKLTDAQDVLGTGPLAPGHYTMVRLDVTSAALYFDNAAAGPACAATVPTPAGRNAPVEISSGIVRLNREFELTSTTATTMLLDFDGDRSVRETGNGRYMMTPVIGVVSVQ